MGICETSTVSNNKKESNSLCSLDKYSTGEFIKNDLQKQKELLLKKNNGFILPENLAKRADINKFYNITQKILGEGASGIVCIGEKNGKQYAIKKIKKDKIKALKPFILEAEISLQLKHENIITYYEIYEDSQYISYVMDLGEGGDLFDFIVGCPLGHLPADIVIDLLIQIFEVVDYLHSVKGIVHRDLKPENFMIKINMYNKPQIKLIDFGFATYIPKNGEKIKEYLGTREYAAPEILEETGYREKVDEWAIGVIMYNMLTGFEPFKGETPSEIKDSVLFATIRFEKIEDVDLRDINKKLLDRFVAKRITCKEALMEIKRIKVERDNYFKGFKRLTKKTPSVVLKKEYAETKEYMSYWENMTTNVRTNLQL
jgi:serine/threonine protein kinase